MGGNVEEQRRHTRGREAQRSNFTARGKHADWEGWDLKKAGRGVDQVRDRHDGSQRINEIQSPQIVRG